jgi:hypothetical protein
MALQSAERMARAMAFLLERLLLIRMQNDEEIELRMDSVTHISDMDYLADFSVVDVERRVHDGHVEVVNGEVAVATLDGKSILPTFFSKNMILQ